MMRYGMALLSFIECTGTDATKLAIVINIIVGLTYRGLNLIPF